MIEIESQGVVVLAKIKMAKESGDSSKFYKVILFLF